jgi:hypothetical protein
VSTDIIEVLAAKALRTYQERMVGPRLAGRVPSWDQQSAGQQEDWRVIVRGILVGDLSVVPAGLCREQRNAWAAVVTAIAPSTGAQLVAGERRRQIDVEEWTEEHDRGHGPERLAAAGYAYMTGHRDRWPWDSVHWKPKNKLRDLIRAGALYQAAVDAERPDFRARFEKSRDRCIQLIDDLLDEACTILAASPASAQGTSEETADA